MKNHYRESHLTMTPAKALQYLKEGNGRFLQNLRANRNLLEMVNDTAEGQFPFAAILSCSDSRTAAELIFDQGLGDIFSVRLAGNIASLNAIASMEFSCKVLGSRLIVVLGHSSCGAVKGACDKVEMGNLPELLSHITPAVDRETATKDDRTSKNKQFVNNVTELSIYHQMERIIEFSPILRDMIEAGEVGLIGANYDVATGKVTFFDEKPKKKVKKAA
jgi:carbonic anhydrase